MNNQSITQLTSRLTKALNSNYDVVDMDEVLFVISELEFAPITKEQLETTRLAKYINQLRRRTTHDLLARRSKNLLKKWREMVIPTLIGSGGISSSTTTIPSTSSIISTTTAITTPAAAATSSASTSTLSLNHIQKQQQLLSIKNSSKLNKIGNISQQQQQSQSSQPQKSQKRTTKQHQQQQQLSLIDEPIFIGTNTEYMYQKNSIGGNNNNNIGGLKKTNTTSNNNKNIKQFKSGLTNGTLGNPINNISGSGGINPYVMHKKKNTINKISSSSSSSVIGNNYNNKNNNNGNSNNRKLSIQQPISFANLLDLQFDNKNVKQQQENDESKFVLIDENNSQSPKFNSLLSNTSDYDCSSISTGNQLQLSGLIQQPHQQQLSRSRISPLDINMDHSLSLLDFDQNSYQNGLCNNQQQQQPQQRIRSLNDIAGGGSGGGGVGGVCNELNINSSTATIDLNDTNSNSGFILNSTKIQKQQLEQQQQLRNNDHNNRAEHRKNKKHKKDKKQRKEKQQQQQQHQQQQQLPQQQQSSLQLNQQSEQLHQQQQNRYSSNLLQSHENSLLNFDDESHTVGGGGGNNNNSSFPIVVQENLSLSNSSLSIFPNSTTTGTNIRNNNNNNNQKLHDQQKQSINNKTDLTFAGKFNKNQTTNIPNTGVIDQNINFITRLNERFSPSVVNQIEPTSNNNIVLIESRSCSPFADIHCSNDNSCCSSTLSHLSLIENELIDIINSHESQGLIDPLRQSSNNSVTRTPALQNIKSVSNIGGNNNLYNENLSQQQQKNSTLLINNDTNLSSITTSTTAPIITSTNNTSGVLLNASETLKKIPKKRGRKKGSRGIDAVLAAASLTKAQTNPNIFMNSQYFENSSKLLTMGSKKVKTTKELLADIQNRKIGSSATSSPTFLQSQSLSRAPSICSDPSRSPCTSDAATISTIARSTPDQINVNIRDNSTDSDLTTQQSSRTTTPSNQHSRKINYDNKCQRNSLAPLNEDSILGSENAIYNIDNNLPISTFINSSIEEEINELYKQLKPINEININWNKNTDIPCTCTVCEIENIANIFFPNDNANKDNSINTKDCTDNNNDIPIVSVNVMHKEKQHDKKQHNISKDNPKSIKSDKPVKSIFDLDYDEDDDPLHSFKLYENKNNDNNINNIVDDENDDTITITNSIKSISDDENSNIDIITKSSVIPVISSSNNIKSETIIDSNTNSNNQIYDSNDNNNTKINLDDIDLNNSIIDNDEPKSPINMNKLPIPIGHKMIDQQLNQQQQFFPQYEIVENTNCLAKQKFNIQNQLITQFHINALHNYYIPNVNGNWDCSMITNNNINTNNDHIFIHNNDNNINDDINELNKKYDLYDRVVPQYSYLIHDLIPKNLNHIQFNENYIRINKKNLRKLEKLKTINNIVINKANNNNNDNEIEKLNIYVKLCEICNKQKIDKEQQKQLLSIFKNNDNNNTDNDVKYIKVINENDNNNQLINKICSVNSNNFTKNILNNINYKSLDLLDSSLYNNNNSQFNNDNNNHDIKLSITSIDSNKQNNNNDIIDDNLKNLNKNNNCDVIENICCNSSNIFGKFLKSNTNNTENLNEITTDINSIQNINLLNHIKNENNNNNDNNNIIINNINSNSCSTYLNNNNSVTKNFILNNQSSELLNNPINLIDDNLNINTIQNQSIELPSTSSNILSQQNYSNNQSVKKIKLKLSGNDNIISVVTSLDNVNNDINDNSQNNNNKRRRSSSCSNSSLKQNQSQINLKLKKRLKLKLKEQDEIQQENQQQIISFKCRKKSLIKENGDYIYSDDDLYNIDDDNLLVTKDININNDNNYNFDVYNNDDDDDNDDNDDDEDDDDGDNGDFHEVVTRDTSNVNDNNNKPHIVLTIKKTPNKLSSPIPTSFNNKLNNNNKIDISENSNNNYDNLLLNNDNDININNELNNHNDSSLSSINLLNNNENNSNNNITILNKNRKAVLQSQSINENDVNNFITPSSSVISLNNQNEINSSQIINNDNNKFNLNIDNNINNKQHLNNNINNDDAGYDHDRLINKKILTKRCFNNMDNDNNQIINNGIIKNEEEQEQEEHQQLRKRHKKSHHTKLKSFDKLFFPYELITSNNEKLFDNIRYSSDNNSNDSNYNSDIYDSIDDDNSNEYNQINNNNNNNINDNLKFLNLCECSSGSSSPSLYNNDNINIINQSELTNKNDYNSLPIDNNYVLKSFNTIKNQQEYQQNNEETINNNIGTVPSITTNIINVNDNNKYDISNDYEEQNKSNQFHQQPEQQHEQQNNFKFKEWHEVLHMNSYNDEPLTILPYVVID